MNCVYCEDEEENLTHFLFKCPAYRDIRIATIELQQPYNEKLEETIGKLLFENRNMEKKKETLLRMWKKRTDKIRLSTQNAQ